MSKRKQSGYTHCACRDCFDVAMDGGLCHECEEAGCDADGDSECCREDAYGCDCGAYGCDCEGDAS